jgi:hypothetical protein
VSSARAQAPKSATRRPPCRTRQQELPHDDELLPHDDELPQEDELPHDDELLPQDEELLPHEELFDTPSHEVPMTYHDESLSEPAPALVVVPAPPAMPVGQGPLPRPVPLLPTDACHPRSSHARRHARRIIHAHQANNPTTATPTRTSAISMISPPDRRPLAPAAPRVPGVMPASSSF